MKVDYEYELSNGWGRWENLVLSALKELKENQSNLDGKLDGVASRVLVIETRSEDRAAGRIGARAWIAICLAGMSSIAAVVLAAIAVFG